jgi:hypothetical protein
MNPSVRAMSFVLLTASVSGSAMAHGDWPAKHGGLMNQSGEISFELVARGRQMVLHVEDHGTPVETRGARGVFEVARGEQTWSSEITTIGGNRLKSVLARGIQKGDRVSAKVVMGDGSIAAPRFVVR